MNGAMTVRQFAFHFRLPIFLWNIAFLVISTKFIVFFLMKFPTSLHRFRPQPQSGFLLLDSRSEKTFTIYFCWECFVIRTNLKISSDFSWASQQIINSKNIFLKRQKKHLYILSGSVIWSEIRKTNHLNIYSPIRVMTRDTKIEDLTSLYEIWCYMSIITILISFNFHGFEVWTTSSWNRSEVYLEFVLR